MEGGDAPVTLCVSITCNTRENSGNMGAPKFSLGYGCCTQAILFLELDAGMVAFFAPSHAACGTGDHSALGWHTVHLISQWFLPSLYSAQVPVPSPALCGPVY